MKVRLLRTDKSPMSAHSNGSGPRSNRYSENRFTNWSAYEPWWLEIQAIHKRFNGRIAKNPSFPKIIDFEPLEGFIRPCTAAQVETQLRHCPPNFIEGLRAVFILAGTRKQLESCQHGARYYGHYWRRCIFLHAQPFGQADLIWLRRFYVRDVLMHEIGHHLDLVNTDAKKRELFAEQFAARYG